MKSQKALQNVESFLNDIQVGTFFIGTRNHKIRINKKESLYQNTLEYFMDVKEELEKEFASLGEDMADPIWKRKVHTAKTEYWISHGGVAAAVLIKCEPDTNRYQITIPLQLPIQKEVFMADSLQEAKKKAEIILENYLNRELSKLSGVMEILKNAQHT